MSNNNQIPKDFYTEMVEWKEQYKLPNVKQINSLAGGEYMKHVKEINKEIDRNRMDNSEAISNAGNCIVF